MFSETRACLVCEKFPKAMPILLGPLFEEEAEAAYGNPEPAENGDVDPKTPVCKSPPCSSPVSSPRSVQDVDKLGMVADLVGTASVGGSSHSHSAAPMEVLEDEGWKLLKVKAAAHTAGTEGYSSHRSGEHAQQVQLCSHCQLPPDSAPLCSHCQLPPDSAPLCSHCQLPLAVATLALVSTTCDPSYL